MVVAAAATGRCRRCAASSKAAGQGHDCAAGLIEPHSLSVVHYMVKHVSPTFVCCLQ